MKTGVTPGTEVKHRVHGRGVVLDIRYRGSEVLGRFGYLEKWVPIAEVVPVMSAAADDADEVRVSVSQIRRGRTLDRSATERVEAFGDRALFEAFRLGIVPNNAVEAWTFGRDEEIRDVVGWLKNQAYGSLVLEGEYGTGKTHLLAFLYAKALEMNYAVCQIGFDPTETPAAFPKRVYRKAIQELRVPTPQGLLRFREALQVAAKSTKPPPMADHVYFGPLLRTVAKGKVSESAWEALEGAHGRDADGIGLHDHTTSANIYCYLLSGLSHLVVNHLGCLGLILLLDEVETASTAPYGYHWQRSLNFFKGLSYVANDQEELLTESIQKLSGTHRGTETGLVYSGWRKYRYLYSIPSCLKIVFAITPGAFTERFREWDKDQPVLTLEPIGARSRRLLFDRFIDAYQAAFYTQLGRDERDPAFTMVSQFTRDGTTRQFIKAMTEMMDFRRFCPNQPLNALFRARSTPDEHAIGP